MLIVFKYSTFALGNLNLILSKFNIIVYVPELLLPVGLSFFVFQSSSYLLDIYFGKLKPERNLIMHSLFVCFFPTITLGPIQRAACLLPQILKKRKLGFEQFQKALLLFLWGAFLKMVIADRIAVFTNIVFENYQEYEGLILIIAALCYSIQIYGDFAGYSSMAIAVAMLFGFHTPENFMRPYLATNIADFWRRWHISLTSWFRDYLYIPLGGNRKGQIRKYLNVLIIFLVSGLWHGAAWNYVIWGGIHAFYQILGALTLKRRVSFCKRINLNRDTMSYRLWQRVAVFVMATFAWIFFRVNTLHDCIGFIKEMFSIWNPWVLFDGTLCNIGLSALEWCIAICSMVILIIASVCGEKKDIKEEFVKQNFLFRFMTYLFLFFAIIILGIYGPGYSSNAFIYAGF